MRSCLPLVFASVFASCSGAATPPPVYPSPEPVTVQAPQDQIWQAAIDLATEMNFPITTIDAQSGYLRTDIARIPEPLLGEWWDCSYRPPEESGGAMPAWEREMLERNAAEKPKEARNAGLAPLGQISLAFIGRADGTQLRVIVSNLHLPRPGRTAGDECQSKGVFEKTFASLVAERWRELYRPQ